MTQPIVNHINTFLANHLPADALKWAGWAGAAGATFGGNRFTDPDAPIVEPSIDRKLRRQRETGSEQ